MTQALSIQQVHEHLGVGRTHIYQLIKEGKLVARKIGRRTIILEHDLEAFAQSPPTAA